MRWRTLWVPRDRVAPGQAATLPGTCTPVSGSIPMEHQLESIGDWTGLFTYKTLRRDNYDRQEARGP